MKSAYASSCAPKSSEECLRLWPGVPSSKGCQKFSRGSGLKTKVLDNVKEYPHLWLCARSSEECLYLKSAYASGYVRSSEECLDLKSAYASGCVPGHLKSTFI